MEQHKQGWHHRVLPLRGGWSGAQMHLWKQRLLLWWVSAQKDKGNEVSGQQLGSSYSRTRDCLLMLPLLHTSCGHSWETKTPILPCR